MMCFVYATCARGKAGRGRKRAPLWLEWGSRGRYCTVPAAKRTSSRNLTAREKRIGVSTYTPPVGGGWRTVRGPPRALGRCALAGIALALGAGDASGGVREQRELREKGSPDDFCAQPESRN